MNTTRPVAKAFSRISFFRITDEDGKEQGQVRLAYTANGTCHAEAYVSTESAYSWEVARGKATGGGYDKQSAALVDALRQRFPELGGHSAGWEAVADSLKSLYGLTLQKLI